MRAPGVTSRWYFDESKLQSGFHSIFTVNVGAPTFEAQTDPSPYRVHFVVASKTRRAYARRPSPAGSAERAGASQISNGSDKKH